MRGAHKPDPKVNGFFPGGRGTPGAESKNLPRFLWKGWEMLIVVGKAEEGYERQTSLWTRAKQFGRCFLTSVSQSLQAIHPKEVTPNVRPRQKMLNC